MKVAKLTLLGGLLGLGGGVVGHAHEEVVDPLSAPEYVKESVEELERKWSFEVCGFHFTYFFC